MTIYGKDLGKIGIAILVIVIMMLIINLTSCSTQEFLTEPFSGDRLITRIDTTNRLTLQNWKFKIIKTEVLYTVNNFGYELPVYVKDSVNYTAGNLLILKR